MLEFTGNDALTGRHLEEFFNALSRATATFREAETRVLSQRNDPAKPEDYASKLRHMSLTADMFEWLEDKARTRAGTGKPTLTSREIEELIGSYRSGKGEFGPAENTGDVSKDVVVQSFADTGKGLFQITGDDSQLAWVKIQVREDALDAFFGLHCIQEGRVDDWMTERVLKYQDAPPNISVNGVVKTTLLNQRKLINRGSPESLYEKCGERYLHSLVTLSKRTEDDGLLEVYTRGRHQRERSNFEIAVAMAYPDLAEHSLRMKQESILEELAKKRSLDLKALTQSISF